MFADLPRLGVGLGYRAPLHEEILKHSSRIDFLEFVSDQFLYAAPEARFRLHELGRNFLLIPHGVGMSIGTATEPDRDYLERLEALVSYVSAPWFSDHLSFSKIPDADVEQLTPLWFTEESLDAVLKNLTAVKNVCPQPFLLENISYYFAMSDNDMTEAEFLTRTLEESDTGLLLDVNNVWINSVNLNFDPFEFLDSIPLDRTVQIHLAGGCQVEDIIVDTHNTAVVEPVWDLLSYVLDRTEVKAILLEWDQDWPEFSVLVDHLDRAREMLSASWNSEAVR